jgi:hypothetical protein
MYIPKKNRFEMFLKRKSSLSGNKRSNNSSNSNGSYNWSEVCTDFIADVVLLRRRISTKSSKISSNNSNSNDPNLCLDQLSEFQKSYVSFPEFSDSSTISNESATDSSELAGGKSAGNYCTLSTSSSFTTNTSNL